MQAPARSMAYSFLPWVFFFLAAQSAWANQPPVAQPDAASTRESTSVDVEVTANDTDPDGDPVSVVVLNPILTPPTNGTAVRLSGSTIRYTPTAGFVGTDTFRYRISDGFPGSVHSALVTVSVAANQPPVAFNDTASTIEGQAVTINVTANDTDPDGDPVSVVVLNPILTPPAHGTATRLSGSTIRYTPAAGFSGTDTFRYRISDGFPGSVHSALVTVTVEPNQAPVAVHDPASTRENASVDIDVMANDSDPNGDPIALVLGDPVIIAAEHGSTQRISDSIIRYTPSTGFAGTDTFRYRITDGDLFHSAGVTVTVVANQAPVAMPDRKATPLDTPFTLNVLANDTDPEGDPIRLVNEPILEPASRGTATRVSDTSIRYVPDSGFSGTDSFRYRITDGFPGTVHSAVVTVRVDNQRPDASPDDGTTHAGTPITLDVVANDTDPEGDTLVLVPEPILIAPGNGSAVRVSDTSITYTPQDGFLGTDTFRYRITDGWGAVHSAGVTVHVTNTAPVARPDSVITDIDTAITIDVKANDSDPDGDSFSVIAIASPASRGTAVRLNNREVRYTPDAGFLGEDSFSYRIRDEHGGQDMATVSVTVADIVPPELDVAGVATVFHGQVKNVTIDGTGLAGANVYVATMPPEQGLPPRVYPTLVSVSVNAEGTRIVARVDATEAGVDGFYNLAIETPGGVTGAPIRVVDRAPVVDLWTPSEPQRGTVHLLQIVGLNLLGANVVPLDPGIRILDLEASDDNALSGLLFISDNVSAGPADLRIDGAGGSTTLTMNVQASPGLTLLPTTKIDTGNALPDIAPEIYFQDPISPHQGSPFLASHAQHEEKHALSEPRNAVSRAELEQNKMFQICLTVRLSASIFFGEILLSLFDDLGDPLTRQALNALLPGQVLDFSSLTLAVIGFLEVEFVFQACNEGVTDALFCVRGGISVMVPAVGGWERSFDVCLGFNAPPQERPAEGQITSQSYTTDNGCVEAFDLSGGSPLGERQGQFRLNCCEDATIRTRTVGRVFDTPFVLEGPLVRTDLMCGPGQIVDLSLEALSFLDDHTIRKDTLGSAEAITDPVWMDTDGDQNPEKDDAVAYTRGRVMRVQAKLVASPPPGAPINVTLRATGPDGIVLEGSGAITGSEAMIELSSTQPLPNMTKRYQPLVFTWSISHDGTTQDIGGSRHPLYITLEDPLPERDLFLTALDLGIGAGDAADSASALARTWASFEGPANVRTWEGRPLFYYRPGEGFGDCAFSSETLLTQANSSGMCGAFAHLLRDALGVNGLATQFIDITERNAELMLVKEWQFLVPTFSSPYRWQLELVQEEFQAIGMVPPKPDGIYGRMKSLAGVAGQNTPTPSEKVFSSHTVVELLAPGLSGTYYDPSYGKTFANEQDFQRTALAGFAKRYGDDGHLEYRVRRAGSSVQVVFTPRQ